jgi:hypothetical protein
MTREIYTHPIYGAVDVSDLATMARLREAAHAVREVNTLRAHLCRVHQNSYLGLRSDPRLEALARELAAQAATLDRRRLNDDGTLVRHGDAHLERTPA